MMKKLFGSKKQEQAPPKPAVDMNNKDQLKEMERAYKKQLQKEMRELERGVLQNDMAQKKAEAELKKAIQTNKDKGILTIYAKQVAQTRRQKARLLNNKAKVQGLVFSLEQMFANMRMTKVLGDTSSLVKQINGLMNVKEMTQTMKDIQKSMMQFGLMNEMVDDVMSTMDEDGDELEDTELDKIIDSVQNPDKYKNKDRQEQQGVQHNDLNDFEARLNQLS